jgi:DNA polymerase-3 subunit alpha
MIKEFTHLHVHSDYSFQDGISNIDRLVAYAAKLGMKNLALTDHGYIHGIVAFWKACKKHNIKPILGCEVYITPFSIDLKDSEHKKRHHLILHAQNRIGFDNLVKLISKAATDGFYYKPRVDKELLNQYSEGIMATSACVTGEINSHLHSSWGSTIDYDKAKRIAGEYAEIFKDRFFLEVQHHRIKGDPGHPNPQEEIIKGALKLKKELNLPVVITNDAHYITADQANLRDLMLADMERKAQDDPTRKIKDEEGEWYIKSPEQMWEKWGSHLPEGLTNTTVMADMVESYEIGLNSGYHLPKFGKDENAETIWKQLLIEGFDRKYPGKRPGDHKDNSKNGPQGMEKDRNVKQSHVCNDEQHNEHWDRFQHEVGVIERLGFRDYFLIVNDFLHHARSNRIPTGPGRGSAAGSMVSYCLGITQLCPMDHNLLFERFLNESRVSLPDIDIDICKERRGEIIRYLGKRYGNDSVAQIGTFGRAKGKGIIRLLGKVCGIAFEDWDALSKSLPKDAGDFSATLADVFDPLSEVPVHIKSKFNGFANRGKKEHDYLKACLGLEGVHKSSGVHAAGVIIAPGPITNYIPIMQANDGGLVTQWDMNEAEDLGLLKMDLLGLDTLTVVDSCIKTIKSSKLKGPLDSHKDVWDIITLAEAINDVEDSNVYNTVFKNGKTLGVFQCDSAGIRQLFIRMRCKNFNDIAAAISLYRPGPLDNGTTESYIRRSQGIEKISTWHEKVNLYFETTYGLAIYQEQIMQASQSLCGYSMNEADKLRKVIGKKKKDAIAELRKDFVDRAMEHSNIDLKKAEAIYDDIEAFGRYGFNKSHAVAYGTITYYTGWLKCYYPTAFMTAILNKFVAIEVDRGSSTRVSKRKNDDKTRKLDWYIKECANLNITVQSPNINMSQYEFTTNDRTIYFGIGALKSIGPRVRDIIQIRNSKESKKFSSFGELCHQILELGLTKTVTKQIVESGAADCFSKSRESLLEIVIGYPRDCRCVTSKREDCKVCKGTKKTKATPGILDDIRKLMKKWKVVETTQDDKIEALAALTASLPMEDYTTTQYHPDLGGYNTNIYLDNSSTIEIV